jgi:endoglucanase Acf2
MLKWGILKKDFTMNDLHIYESNAKRNLTQMKRKMEINPDLVVFVMKKDLYNTLSIKRVFFFLKYAYLFVEIFKIHEKEAKNDKNSHKIRNAIIRLVPLIKQCLFRYLHYNCIIASHGYQSDQTHQILTKNNQ